MSYSYMIFSKCWNKHLLQHQQYYWKISQQSQTFWLSLTLDSCAVCTCAGTGKKFWNMSIAQIKLRDFLRMFLGLQTIYNYLFYISANFFRWDILEYVFVEVRFLAFQYYRHRLSDPKGSSLDWILREIFSNGPSEPR